MIPAIGAIVVSAMLLAILCAGDPKRRRTARLGEARHGPGVRRALVAASAVPGVLLASAGDAAALFVWIGGYAIAGWLLAQRSASASRRA